MIKNLVIVESPAKAKTIEKFLGKDFTVKSSFGHIRDLRKDNKAIDVENGFTPVYIVPQDKVKLVDELKKLSKKAEIVWLATDEDREGEAISWHLYDELGLNDESTKRIVFHEITKSAIQNAIKNPRKIDRNLVNGQQARRILDRLVGFELSPVLWTKINPGLSAGRVQSVAVRLIVDRERDINKFESVSTFKLAADFFNSEKKKFKAELPNRFTEEKKANEFLEKCVGATYKVDSLETKPGKKTPSAPFITSTLQQEASRKLGFSVTKTMMIAQRLYETGHITYMRTDSVNLADSAIASAKEEITNNYGAQYVQARKFKTKSDLAQEAHEAIRPTDFSVSSLKEQGKELQNDHLRLYELIWRKAIASQMADAVIEKTVAKISISTNSDFFEATGEMIKFDGFLKVYMEDNDDDDEKENNGKASLLPKLEEGQTIPLIEINATERFSKASPRFTEASLVKKLEELGIGRPSTYAPTISTIQKRGYIIKEDREGVERKYRILNLRSDKITQVTKTEITGKEKAKLFPTDIALIVNDFLLVNFKEIMDFSFTAKVEKEFDDIATGAKEWNSMLDEFYAPFHEQIEVTKENVSRSEASGTRQIGVHPKTGKEIVARLGRYGPMIQIGSTEDENEKPLFAALRKGQRIDTITLEEALELFKLPRDLGEFEEKKLTVGIGRFGPYIKHAQDFYTLGKEEDPLEVSRERCLEIIAEKRLAKANSIIKVFEDTEIKVLKGRWGPYIANGKQNIRIPKDTVPEDLTLADCLKMIEEAPVKPKRGKFGKKK